MTYEPTPNEPLSVPVDAFAVSVEAGPDGMPVVVKDHSGPLPPCGRTASEHLRAVDCERRWLRAAEDLDAVVTPVEWPDRSVVATVFAGGPTLRSHAPAAADLAAVLVPVCTALEALRERAMVHGSVAPEHIIIGPDGGGVLCSPNTGDPPPAPEEDLRGLGRTISHCIEQWSASPPDDLEQWLLLAQRLESGDPSFGPRRAAATLAGLSEPRPVARRRSRARTAAVLGLVAMTATWWLAQPSSTVVDGPRLQVGRSMVQVGRDGQRALAPGEGSGCDHPAVLVLDPTTSWVWVFEEVSDGAAGTPLARVPGATDLTIDHDGPCPTVVATGPAGQVTLTP